MCFFGNLKISGVIITTKKHKAGGKYTGRHTTVIGEADSLLRFAEDHDGIKKISVGLINNAGRTGSPLRVSVRHLEDQVHGLRITVSKGSAHQIFRFYLSAHVSSGDLIPILEDFGNRNQGKRGKKVRTTRNQRRIK
jgi:hypothetical protein